MFIAALFTIARKRKQLSYPLTHEWIKKSWYIYTMEYSVHFSSVAQSCPTISDPRNCSTPGCPVHHQILELEQTHVHWSVRPSNHLILCHSLLLLPSIFPSLRVFSNESIFPIRWSKYWTFNFSISPSNEYSVMISLRIDWFELLEVQGTLKKLLQHHNSKAPILRHSALFMVQPSHPYITTGKTIALARWTFVSEVMSVLFNMLSGLVIAFLPRNKHLLILRLQSSSVVILEPKKIVCHSFHCFPIYLAWSDGTRCWF